MYTTLTHSLSHSRERGALVRGNAETRCLRPTTSPTVRRRPGAASRLHARQPYRRYPYQWHPPNPDDILTQLTRARIRAHDDLGSRKQRSQHQQWLRILPRRTEMVLFRRSARTTCVRPPPSPPERLRAFTNRPERVRERARQFRTVKLPTSTASGDGRNATVELLDFRLL